MYFFQDIVNNNVHKMTILLKLIIRVRYMIYYET